MYIFVFLGHFAFFNPYESGSDNIAQLESETMEAVDQACLEMWHYTSGWLSHGEFILSYCVSKQSSLFKMQSSPGYMVICWKCF